MGHARKRETACEAIHMRCVRCVRKRRNRKYETLHIQSGDLGDGIGSRDVKRYTKGRGGAEERGGGIVTASHHEPRMRAVLRRKQAPSYGVAVALQKGSPLGELPRWRVRGGMSIEALRPYDVNAAAKASPRSTVWAGLCGERCREGRLADCGRAMRAPTM